MSAINWKLTQQRLLNRGFDPRGIDNVPGKSTYAALFALVGGGKINDIHRLLGAQAAEVLPAKGISDSAERLAEFLAQTAHESAGFTRFEENMRYSARRLMVVWPGRFPTLAKALPYAWDPSDPDAEDVALANLVYGGRMGNEVDGTNDNDGWDHRGGGMLQHTGAGEYATLKKRLGYTPSDVRDPAKTVAAAADYWERRNVSHYADHGDWRGSRKAVNGGSLGLDDIRDKRLRALEVLKP